MIHAGLGRLRERTCWLGLGRHRGGIQCPGQPKASPGEQEQVDVRSTTSLQPAADIHDAWRLLEPSGEKVMGRAEVHRSFLTNVT